MGRNAGHRGTFVISWAQTEIDGIRNAPLSTLTVGAQWRWWGEASRIDGPDGLITLDGAAGLDDLHARAARSVGRILRAAGVAYAPGKASNAGGVAVSGLEMTQNRSGQSWDAETVDRELHKIMVSIHTLCLSASERYGRPGDYVVGANIGAFAKVADAMLDQGVI